VSLAPPAMPELISMAAAIRARTIIYLAFTSLMNHGRRASLPKLEIRIMWEKASGDLFSVWRQKNCRLATAQKESSCNIDSLVKPRTLKQRAQAFVRWLKRRQAK
jgi:hypothetical protein